jgi:murein DD-endopeptidase MepM/ murein hydrolase activator NlpD
LSPGLVLLALACTSPAAQSAPASKAPAAEPLAVKVITRKEGNTTHFLVDNRELCEVTVTFELGLVNLKPNVPLPYTTAFPAGRVTEAFSLTPENPAADWSFTFTDNVKLGSNCARHDGSHVYELPYGPEAKLEVTQAYDGKFSHKGSNKYAIDWQMPEGTPVRAARGGVVVRAKDDSNRGGGTIDFDHDNNYVLIRHDDGTLGQYCHLQKGGVLVKPGQTVAAGDPIAHSGNTGFSTGPHLHFCVFTATSGRESASIPVKFRTSDGPALTLVSGRAYQAASVSLAMAQAPAAASHVKASQAVGAATQ